MSIIKSYEEGRLTRLNTLRYEEMSQTNTPLVTKRVPTSVNGTGPTTNQASARVDDLTRIGKLLTRPQGLKWTLNNTALNSFTVPQKGGGKLIDSIISTIGSGLENTLGTVGSTLAQVAVNGTGVHFPKGFVGAGAPKKTKESKYSLGDPGARGAYTPFRVISDDYSATVNTAKDQINLEDVNSESSNVDFINFNFSVFSPDSSNSFRFRAFLDSFNDNFSGNWNTYNYVGRGENFYTYKTFDRSLSFSFKVAAQTRDEMKPLYRKLATLASSTAPSYSNDGFMRGTLGRITIGDYVVNQTGYFESIRFSWEKDYPWEIRYDPNGLDKDMQQLPTVLNCSVYFKPIHSFIPQSGIQPYITNPGLGWVGALGSGG